MRPVDGTVPGDEPYVTIRAIVARRKEIASGVVGAITGFIVGFFVAQGIQGPPATSTRAPEVSDSGTLPENHPTPEQMARIQEMVAKARQAPQDRDIRVQLGNLFYDMGRFDAAIPWYEEALALNSDDVMVTTDLGTCYLFAGDPQKAIELYKKALTIEPGHPQTLQNLGIVYFSQGEYSGAIEVWEQLLQAHPDYPQADQVRQQIETARMHLEKAAQAG